MKCIYLKYNKRYFYGRMLKIKNLPTGHKWYHKIGVVKLIGVQYIQASSLTSKY